MMASMAALCTYANDIYQEPDVFLHETFGGEIPKAEKLWIKKELKQQIRSIMEHDLNVVRLRYWGQGQRTAWILEEIGKERLITVGIVINKGKIERVKVLVFRESRGWEIRYPFFTDQFKDAALSQNNKLDRNIDGISGATLSVKAMTKLTRLALLLHHHSKFNEEEITQK